MDIQIESTGVMHPGINVDYFKNELQKKYEEYKFITKCILKYSYDEKDGNEISIQIELKNGGRKFVSHSDEKLNQAFKAAVSKLDKMINKYKVNHFHS